MLCSIQNTATEGSEILCVFFIYSINIPIIRFRQKGVKPQGVVMRECQTISWLGNRTVNVELLLKSTKTSPKAVGESDDEASCGLHVTV